MIRLFGTERFGLLAYPKGLPARSKDVPGNEFRVIIGLNGYCKYTYHGSDGNPYQKICLFKINILSPMEPEKRIGLLTYRLQGDCSTVELLRHGPRIIIEGRGTSPQYLLNWPYMYGCELAYIRW